MYPNNSFSSGSYMNMFTTMLPNNYYNESVADQNEASVIGDTTMTMLQSIDHGNSNAFNSHHVDGEQNLQCQGLSLSLGTFLPSTSSVPPFQYQYHHDDTGLILLMNASLSKATTTTSNDDDVTERDDFCNNNPSYQCLQGSQVFSNISLNSQYLKASQELLDEVVNVRKQRGIEKLEKKCDVGLDNKSKDIDGKSSGPSNDSNSNPSCEIFSAEKQNFLDKKTKLLCMLDEVDKRYRQYCHEMQIVVSSLDMVAGCGAAEPYTKLALRTISRHFRCLRDAISDQIQVIQKRLGEQEGIPRLSYVDQHLRQQKAIQQLGVMRQAWRPQRGLPENAVSILRAWLFEHFLNPYPKDSEKIMLARQTGLTRNQVANWFINARVRLWKPMVEEIYKQEFNDSENTLIKVKRDYSTQEEISNSDSVELHGKNEAYYYNSEERIDCDSGHQHQEQEHVSLALELRNCERDGIDISQDDGIKKRHNNEILASSSHSTTDLLDYDHFTDSGKQQHMFGNPHLLHQFVL